MNRRIALKSLFATFAAASLPLFASQKAAAATTHKVLIRGFKFVPADLSVAVGDIIVFENRDSAPHTATAKDNSWDTKTLGPLQSGEIDVTADMDDAYFCRFHPNMKGTLTIAG